ncbi:hypothetical protein Q4566_16995, partial [Tamlana sp. 2_MG-2023]|uniref:hypothetical protein n=1 Tax=unclassified Tamlana TaxID=2614803 RepID=UPI0026E11623
MMKKKILLQAIVMLIGVCLGCKPKETPKAQSIVTIQGTVVGNGGVRDSIRILFGGLIPRNKVFGVQDTMIYTNAEGNFKFQSKSIKGPTRITICAFKKREGEIGQHFKDVLRDYVV